MITETMSISERYIRVSDLSAISYGGSQKWFEQSTHSFHKLLSEGGCGLVSVCDYLLYLEQSAGRLRKQPIKKDRYLKFLHRIACTRYPVLPYFGSFAFQVFFFLNAHLLKTRDPRHLLFLFTCDRKKRLDVIKDQLKKGLPVILIIGQHFLRFDCEKGVTLYQEQNGKMVSCVRNLYCHYMNITGIRVFQDVRTPIYLEVSSWGRKYYIDYEELCTYIRKYSAPMYTGVFFLA